jgi:hypothetical protein
VSGPIPAPLRAGAIVIAVVLLGVASVLGAISVIALRRSEGVFMPAGYAALLCLVGGVLLLRFGLRG